MIFTDNLEHGERIMRSFNAQYAEVTMEVISRAEQGVLYGGVVYENYTGKGGSCLVHVAGFVPNWLNRDLLYIIFDYPYKQLECNRTFAQIKASNTASLEFCLSLGYEKITTLEGVYSDDDMILLQLRKADCRYLDIKPRHVRSNKEVSHG